MDIVGLDAVRDIEMVYNHESGMESDITSKLLDARVKRTP